MATRPWSHQKMAVWEQQRHPDPYAAPALDSERAKLHRALLVNLVADAGYIGLATALSRNRQARVAGAGAAVAIQGGFLLLHDAHYAWRTRRGPRH